jgi:prepilin-type N-terminal cleavage/methylation domain-containing protein
MLKLSPQSSLRRPRQQGFTLIELLMVIAVILILASITFGISRGVQNAQARAKAKAELAVISQALEQFKSRYGDYPWHKSGGGFPGGVDDTNVMLTYALTGRLKLEPDPNNSGQIRAVKVADSMDNTEVEKNPKFVDITKFSTTGTDDIPEMILDPWGNPYKYRYKWDNSPQDWDVFGYHLYSTGSKGRTAHTALEAEMETKESGVFKEGFRDVANAEGIIFAGE